MNEKIQKMVADLKEECMKQNIAMTFIGTKDDEIKHSVYGSAMELAIHLLVAEHNIEQETAIPIEVLKLKAMKEYEGQGE